MKNLLWIVVVVMLWICAALAQKPQQDQAVADEPVVVMSSAEEAAGVVMLEFLSADENDAEGLAIAKSYLDTQLGFDPTSEQDQKDKTKVGAAVLKYSKGMKELNAEWERHIPNDREREAHQFDVVQRISKLQRESAAVFKGTKAWWKVQQIQNTLVENEQ